ncbi:hypothetical protein niasHT_021266 [Heterodera trifolii]|uniref:Uncharacterized protein n=1 Tax=Heterodera trifolii TaxID=157864 RepID=A0ABD2JND7_9BILA
MEWAGSRYFALKGADPSPRVATALSRGSADPLSSTDPLSPSARTPSLPRTPSLYCRGPLPTILPSVGADPPLSPLPRPPPHHSVSVGADPLSSTNPSPYCAAGPSPPFRRQSSRTPSLSPLPRPPPHHSVSVGADPLSSTNPSPYCAAGPSPPFRRQSARTLSLPRTPLPTAPRAPPHHSAVSRRGPPLFHGPSLFTAAAPSPLFRCPGGADPLSSTDTLSLLPRPPPHHSVDRRRGPPLSTAAAPSPPFRRPGGADRLWPSPRTPGARVLMRMVEGAGRRENFAQNGARGEILSPFSLGGGGMKACKI